MILALSREAPVNSTFEAPTLPLPRLNSGAGEFRARQLISVTYETLEASQQTNW